MRRGSKARKLFRKIETGRPRRPNVLSSSLQSFIVARIAAPAALTARLQ
jgi:hypothetical protein